MHRVQIGSDVSHGRTVCFSALHYSNSWADVL
jgi:hypothetical protein